MINSYRIICMVECGDYIEFEVTLLDEAGEKAGRMVVRLPKMKYMTAKGIDMDKLVSDLDDEVARIADKIEADSTRKLMGSCRPLTRRGGKRKDETLPEGL